MARFLITHHGGDEIPREADGRPDPEFVPGGSAARNNAVIMAWLTESANSVVDWGGSVRPAATVSGEGTNDGLATGPLNGWTVIEAPDTDVAARLLQNHPFIILGGGLNDQTVATSFLRDTEGLVLVVSPAYKAVGDLPGGSAEADEVTMTTNLELMLKP